MPSNFLNADVSFPWNDGADDHRKLAAIESYLFMLLEQLRYTLYNLEPENFNDGALDALKEMLTGDIRLTLGSLTLTITEGEGGMNYYFTSDGLQVGDKLTVLRFYSTTGALPPVGKNASGVIVNANGQPVLTNGWYSAWQSAWSGSTTTNVYAIQSYDSGNTWGTVSLVQGKNGQNGSDASVTFNNVTRALANLFVKVSSGTPTQISDYYMYSPTISGGTIYGMAIYAGEVDDPSDYYAKMDGSGISVYAPRSGSTENPKIGMGLSAVAGTDYPFISLGIGSGEITSGYGIIQKLERGIWIGDSSIVDAGGRYPGGQTSITDISSQYPDATGIFISFNPDKVYKYLEGVPSELGTATFG